MSGPPSPGVYREHRCPDRRPPRLELEPWQRAYGLAAGLTIPPSDFRLDPAAPSPAFESALTSLAASLPGAFPSVVIGRQVHGAAIGIHDRSVKGVRVTEGLDGHVTADAGVLLTVTVADCVPVYLADPRSGAVGLLHAGWRGIAAGVLEAGVLALREVAGGDVENIVMHCGAGICGNCYEVGSEVFRALGQPDPAPRKGLLDLHRVLVARARGQGIRHVTRSGWCTVHDRGLHSHRGSRGLAGRMAAYLGRPWLEPLPERR